MKQMHTHKINQGNLSSLQVDIFNRIQTQTGYFTQMKEQIYCFLQTLLGRSSYQIFMEALVYTSLVDGVIVLIHLAPKLSHFPFSQPVNLWLSAIGADGK